LIQIRESAFNKSMLARVRTKPIRREQGMNLIELLTIIGLISCGGFLGAGIAELIGLIRGGDTSKIVAHGGVIGCAATFLGLMVWGWWFGKMDSIHPPCRCGKYDWKDFELSRAENFRNVWQCACGKQYSWPKWQLWFEITERGTARLFMKRNYFRRWREATELEITNQSVEITRSRPRP
jgi:hypothetical protein